MFTTSSLPPPHQKAQHWLYSGDLHQREEVIERLLDLSEREDEELNNEVMLLSARFTRINKQELKGTSAMPRRALCAIKSMRLWSL